MSAVFKLHIQVPRELPVVGSLFLLHTQSRHLLLTTTSEQLLQSSFKCANYKGESKDINWLGSQTGEVLFSPETLITA